MICRTIGFVVNFIDHKVNHTLVLIESTADINEIISFNPKALVSRVLIKGLARTQTPNGTKIIAD
jgi:hypothetical protein